MKISTLSAAVAMSLLAFVAHAEEEKELTLDGELGFIFTSGNTKTT